MISTSSENETESDYIMSLESDEDYETMSSDNEERHDSDISEEKLFVDEALAKDKLPSFDGDFAPYFQNLTTAALFRSYCKEIRRFRSWRERLPLPSISAKSISISSKKTPSTLKDSKMAYQLSISDIIWNVLNNPSLLKEMYFGAGVDSKKQNPSTGMVPYGQSHLFSVRTINDIREPTVSAENPKVLDYSDLPGNFKGELRQNRSLSGEVWLQDEPFLTITTSQISEKVAADTLRITEIL
ncbi:hypothetical protein GLOIN_2v1776429 [Rhizophagus irregularis DAOM 181602=DAOM 197198]|nr:hypothetical protein GLOIN_2v1776429 [Rhizophagus irregularis DAOM 181602=DAOM 197198]